jgi:hypothetical protein
MMRLESKEVRQKDHHPEVVLTTNPKEDSFTGCLIAGQATELDTQTEAPP